MGPQLRDANAQTSRSSLQILVNNLDKFFGGEDLGRVATGAWIDHMLTNVIFSGAKNRFSKIKIISTHGGGTIPYLITRVETLEQVFGPGKGRARLSLAEIREGLASFYYDLTAATSPAQLFALQQMVPLSHLLMGFDNPFMPGWTFPPAIQDMQHWNDFSDADISSIAHQNAESLYPALAERLHRSKAA